jgi:vacuolar-type H+-ATPase subunit H
MSTTFESKTASHIYSYALVKPVVDYALSLSLIGYVYKYLAVVYNSINSYVLTPYLLRYLVAIDSYFNFVLTKYFDNLVLPILVSYYQQLVKLINYPQVTYLKPINDYSLKHLQATFPDAKVSVENVNSEISKSYYIINQFVSNLFKTVVCTSTTIRSKTDEFTNSVVSTYNKEVSAAKDSNIVSKNISASYNTATTTYETYIKPLQQQTSELVTDGKKKANDLVVDGKKKATNYINDVTTQTKTKATDFINDGKKRASEFVTIGKSNVVEPATEKVAEVVSVET